MAMSRKHYNPIAATLNRHYRSAKENPFEPERARDYAALVVALVARDLAEIFEKDNPDFDFDRFMEAAGVAEMGAL